MLQYCALEQLNVDDSYQRSLEAASSITLIRRIATFWDWGLCQPLYIARRSDGKLYVVDGQHRWAAAVLRGDIWQLPCVVRSFASVEEEAAAFVALNQERRPLSNLQIFKAAVAGGDMEAAMIVQTCEEAGLRIATSTNLQTAKPGALSNIAGLQRCYRVHGLPILAAALDVLAQAYKDQILRYAGSIFPGIVAIVADEVTADVGFVDGELFGVMTEMVRAGEQGEWGRDINKALADGLASSRSRGAEFVFRQAWAEVTAELLEDAA